MNSMIQPVSNPISGAVQPPAAAGTERAPGARQAENQAPARAQRPAMDEYAPEEKHEPSGRYWPGKDGNGQPKLYFDGPEPAADGPEKTDGWQKKAADKKVERCTGSTDRVDREIEGLKRRRESLEQQLSVQTDGARAKALARELAQVERELGQKDNDTYRRQHTVFS